MTLMDTAQLLGGFGDFVGAILVAVTLVYLAVQVRQNTRALRTQSRQAALAVSQATLNAAIDHPDILLAMMRGLNTLSPEENIKVHFWLVQVMRAVEFAWLQFRDGVTDDVQWNQERLVMQSVLSDEINQVWWKSAGRQIFAAEFVAYVDDLVRVTPITNVRQRLASWSNQATQRIAS